MSQLALLDVTTGDARTDREVAMLRGSQAALNTPTPCRDRDSAALIEISFAYDPAAPEDETLAIFLRAAFTSWLEVSKARRKGDLL